MLAVFATVRKVYDRPAGQGVCRLEGCLLDSHGPDTNYVDRGENRGKSASHEVLVAIAAR